MCCTRLYGRLKPKKGEYSGLDDAGWSIECVQFCGENCQIPKPYWPFCGLKETPFSQQILIGSIVLEMLIEMPPLGVSLCHL